MCYLKAELFVLGVSDTIYACKFYLRIKVGPTPNGRSTRKD